MTSPSSAAEFFRVGQRLTDFTNVDVTIARTAHGGFGAVALGPDQAAGKWRALKILRPDVLAGAETNAQQRLQNLFLREALTWVGLWPHPNLLTAQFVCEIDGQLMLVLDYADEGSLRDKFDEMRQRGQWFTVVYALWQAQQIAAGLVALHTPNPDHMRPDPIVHRDLKPENILLDQYGYAMITDFGLAKAVAETLSLFTSTAPTADLDLASLPTLILNPNAGPTISNAAPVSPSPIPVNGQHTQAYQTRRGAALGTPAYMAPEQWMDASLAERPADAYAFGIILAELLTSRHPLLALDRGYSLVAWRQAHLAGQPVPLRRLGADAFAAEGDLAGLDTALAQLETLVARLLAKDATARPSLAEALSVLQAAARTLGKEPYTPPDVYPHTTEHARIFWKDWADAYDSFSLYAEALPRIERARQLAPYHPFVLTSYGDILVHLGRREEAETAYRQSLETIPAADRPISLNQLGLLLKDAGRFAEADEMYAEAVDLPPENAVVWFNRASNQGLWALAEDKSSHPAEARAHVEQGLVFIEKAMALNPNDTDYSRLAQALRQLRDSL